MRFEMNAVVAHQAREPQQAGVRRLNERECKLRFAGSRRPTDEDGARADQHGRGVHGRSLIRHHIAGSRTMKRAPSTKGVSSEAAGACWRFSAQMRPPCASMICLEIDRPRPEFCPKAWCGRCV